MATRSTTGKYVGNQWDRGEIPLPDDRLVGIEIEVENAPGLPLADPQASAKNRIYGHEDWMQVQDLSLRNNGAEFVSIPLPISQVAEAITSLFKYEKECLHKWVGSIRTGIHVHVNVRDFEAHHLRNLAVTYPLIEPALFDHVGAAREECIYCIPWYRAAGDSMLAAKHFTEGTPKRGFLRQLQTMAQHLSKYSALYLSPITRIGTVEFRHAPTWLDGLKIVQWANTCERIVTYARTAPDPETIIQHFENSPEDFVHSVTGGFLPYPDNYYRKVCRLGADILAESLFPDVLPEWIRVSDAFVPFPPIKKVKPKPYPWSAETGDLYPPIGTVKMIGLTKYVWHGSGAGLGWKPAEVQVKKPSKLVAEPSQGGEHPHGYVVYDDQLNDYKYWDGNEKKWKPYTTAAIIAATDPAPSGMYQIELSQAQAYADAIDNQVLNAMNPGKTIKVKTSVPIWPGLEELDIDEENL